MILRHALPPCVIVTLQFFYAIFLNKLFYFPFVLLSGSKCTYSNAQYTKRCFVCGFVTAKVLSRDTGNSFVKQNNVKPLARRRV